MIASPCIDVCKIDEASGLCLGCWRTLAEIAAWGGAGDDAIIFVKDGLLVGGHQPRGIPGHLPHCVDVEIAHEPGVVGQLVPLLREQVAKKTALPVPVLRQVHPTIAAAGHKAAIGKQRRDRRRG